MKKIYLRTGEFAKLCNVNKKTLLYYAEEGLFMPIKTAENGYHYYELEQVFEFYILRSMRDMGVSVKQLKLRYKQQTLDLQQIIADCEAQVNQKLRELLRIRHNLKIKKNLLKEADNIAPGTIAIRNLPQQHLLLSEPLDGLSSESSIKRFQEHINACAQYHLSEGHPTGTMVRVKDAAHINEEKYAYVFTFTHKKPPQHEDSIQPLTRPAGSYLMGWFACSIQDYSQSYTVLLSYARAHKLELAEYIYEESLCDEAFICFDGIYRFRLLVQVMNTVNPPA